MAERRTQLLGGLPCDVDLVVAFIGCDRSVQARLLALSEALPTAAQDHADAVQRVTGMPTMAKGLLLDAAPHLIEGLPAQLHNVEGIGDRDRVGQLVIDGVLVPCQ